MDTLLPQTNVDTPIDSSTPNSINNSANAVNLISLKGYFGGQDQTQEDTEAISFIYKFFADLGTTEMGEILMAVRNIERKIGPATLETSRAQAVFRYLRLQQTYSQIGQELEGMTRGF